MSDNTINAALRRLGYTSDEQTGHGFRLPVRRTMMQAWADYLGGLRAGGQIVPIKRRSP
jgi:hypothetical protein